MMKYVKLAPLVRTALLVWCLLPGTGLAADDLQSLIKEVQASAGSEALHDKAREARFKQSLDERTRLMAQAKGEVDRLLTARDALKASFEDNETTLGDLQEQLARRSGDLGELFGVFRQTAGDAQSMLYDSLVSLDRPERQATIDALASRKAVPSIVQMQSLWQLLLEEIVLSGETSKRSAPVIKPNGQSYQADVIRVGTFNAISGDNYLRYLPENHQLVEFARQPAGYIRAGAARLSAAPAGKTAAFALDPSRGVLLGLLVQSPSLLERIEQGKLVGYAILIVAAIGLLIVAQRLLELSRLGRRIKKQLADMAHVNEDNPLGRVLAAYYQNRQYSVEVIARKLEEAIFKEVAHIRKGLPLIKVLAAIAPLMGLLGTVTGMIGTFQAITLFGTGDPKLMAGGISQALVTTVLGLVAAIPLLLSHSLLTSRATQLAKVLGEQAAGMVATQAENIERQRQAAA